MNSLAPAYILVRLRSQLIVLEEKRILQSLMGGEFHHSIQIGNCKYQVEILFRGDYHAAHEKQRIMQLDAISNSDVPPPASRANKGTQTIELIATQEESIMLYLVVKADSATNLEGSPVGNDKMQLCKQKMVIPHS